MFAMKTNHGKQMKGNFKITALGSVSVLTAAAMFILPLTDSTQSLVSTTVSTLGAQHSSCGWIMNGSIVLLSLASVLAGWSSFEGLLFDRGILLLFGCSMILMSVFRDAPSDPGTVYSTAMAGWHSYFASAAMVTFIIMAFASLFMQESDNRKLSSAIAGVSVIIILLMTAETDKADWILQRLFFLISPAWMIINFR